MRRRLRLLPAIGEVRHGRRGLQVDGAGRGAAGRHAVGVAAPLRAVGIVRQLISGATGHVVQFLEYRAVRCRIADRAFGNRPVLDHRRQSGAGTAHAALDSADSASADARRVLVREAARAHRRRRLGRRSARWHGLQKLFALV